MNEKMSQDDINNLINSNNLKDQKEKETVKKTEPSSEINEQTLSKEEIDTLGEIGNIFMGSASTTLALLLNNKVEITTPVIELFSSIDDSYVMDEEHVIVEINYTEGLQGIVIFALKKPDAAVIADLMMGGSGKVEKQEIGELQLSAVGEAMNQMVGTASTSLSGMLNYPVNISHPDIKLLQKDTKIELKEELLSNPIVTVKFNLIVGDMINSDIVQFMSINAAKTQVDQITNIMKNMSQSITQDAGSQSVVDSLIKDNSSEETFKSSDTMTPPESPKQAAPSPMHQPAAAQDQGWGTPPTTRNQDPVTVQPVQFASFDNTSNVCGETNRNLNLVMDINLGLTVELGRTELPIKNVLELTRGSIIELDKVAGEPVELYVNGKLIAKGEVVVIEDNFGLRITNIISPEQRIKEI